MMAFLSPPERCSSLSTCECDTLRRATSRVLDRRHRNVAGIPKQGGPIGMMLMEHDEGRSAVRRMDEAIAGFGADPAAGGAFAAAAFDYANLLSMHIFKENNVLFRMADQRIPAAQDAWMVEAYREHEAKASATGAYERYEPIVAGLEARYGK